MKLPLLPLAFCLLGVPWLLQAQEVTKPTVQTLVIKAAHLLDPARGAVQDNVAVVIEGDKIKGVGPAAQIIPSLPTGAKVIDLGQATVLPGLIDCHVHLSSNPGKYYESILRQSSTDIATIMHLYARRTLLAGFTTVRNVGAADYLDFALRRAINAGDVAGPRMLCCGPPLSATGGHGDLNGMSPDLHIDTVASGIADGPDAIRKTVRNNVKYGADWIKILASAGVLSEEESVGRPQYSEEEMRAAVDEARLWGRFVAAHAHGA